MGVRDLVLAHVMADVWVALEVAPVDVRDVHLLVVQVVELDAINLVLVQAERCLMFVTNPSIKLLHNLE